MEARVQAKDIPVGADVECIDGLCGACTAVVVEPQSETVTHLVVREHEFPHVERLVPLSRVAQNHPSRIHLDCRLAELRHMPEFVETEYLPGSTPYFFWPVGIEAFAPLVVEHERVPAGELAIHRGARVQAADGAAGRVRAGSLRLVAHAVRGRREGERVLVLIRPESLTLEALPDGETPDGALVGRVAAHVFLGAMTRLKIDTEAGEIAADLPSTGAGRFAVGARVAARVAPELPRILDLSG